MKGSQDLPTEQGASSTAGLRVDSSNEFGVVSFAEGHLRIHNARPLQHRLTKDQANRLAAWLVILAGERARFERMMADIEREGTHVSSLARMEAKTLP